MEEFCVVTSLRTVNLLGRFFLTRKSCEYVLHLRFSAS